MATNSDVAVATMNTGQIMATPPRKGRCKPHAATGSNAEQSRQSAAEPPPSPAAPVVAAARARLLGSLRGSGRVGRGRGSRGRNTRGTVRTRRLGRGRFGPWLRARLGAPARAPHQLHRVAHALDHGLR